MSFMFFRSHPVCQRQQPRQTTPGDTQEARPAAPAPATADNNKKQRLWWQQRREKIGAEDVNMENVEADTDVKPGGLR